KILLLYLTYNFFMFLNLKIMTKNYNKKKLIIEKALKKQKYKNLTYFIFKYFNHKQIKLITIYKLIIIFLIKIKLINKTKKIKLKKIKKLLSNYEKDIFCKLTKLEYKTYYIYKTKIYKSHIYKDIEVNYRYVKNSRVLLNKYDFISIDEEGTIEIDDAICVNKINNKTEILVAIADLSKYIPLSLFHIAYNNQNSLYFTYNNFYMLINKNVIKNFSLIKNSIKPVIIFRLLFSKDLDLIDFDFDFKLIKIKENYSYDLANKYEVFYQYNIQKIAYNLLNKRLKNGSIFLNIPKLKLDKNLKQIKPVYFLNNYRFIIQELMIITNYIASKIATKYNIPFIYLTNNTQINEKIKGKIINNPLEIYNITRNIEISLYSIDKKNHNLIGYESYTHITSPIRRFIDIINQRQILSLFYDTDPYYDNQELKEFIKTSNNENIQKNNLYRNYLKNYLKYFLYINNIDFLKGYITYLKDNLIKIYLSDYLIEIEENKNNIKILKGNIQKNQEIIFKILR
ncbi:MAG: RNB domain-containing ribonuclease, partial [bacterium]